MKSIPHTFSSYELTAEEELQGQLLNQLQQAALQNLLCTVAKQKLELVLDTAAPLAFTQQEAYLRGQYDVLTHLLSLNEMAAETLRNPPTNQ